MTAEQDAMRSYLEYSKWTKPRLADWLIAHGTVYPNRAGLLRWSKQDLVNSVVEGALERAAS